MIVEKVERDIQVVGTVVEGTMGFDDDPESQAIMFNVLRKTMYADPIGSVLREYMANARDEHKKFGVQRPFEITFPTQFQPELRIRDFAGGLEKDGILHFFGKFGASDKRKVKNLVGHYGLGCKSGHAYGDSYTITGYKDGRFCIVNFYIDQSEVGKYAVLGEGETDEPNGILVTVPVLTQDINRFVSKGLAAMTYFKQKPVIKGLSYEPTFDTKRAVIEGDDWRFNGSGSPVVVMGEIGYPVPSNSMGEIPAWERKLLNNDIEIYVEIGEVEVTSSRESLQMSPKTIAAIRARLASMREKMVEHTQEAFGRCKTMLEAKMLYHSLITSGSGFGGIVKESGARIEFNGVELENSYITFAEFEPHNVVTFVRGRRSSVSQSRGKTIRVERGIVLYYDDTNGAQTNYSRRAQTLLDAGASQVLLIQSSAPKMLEQKYGITPAELKSYAAVTPAKPKARVGNGGRIADRTKHKHKVFVLNRSRLRLGFSVASDAWTPTESDLSKGIYLPIDRFQPNAGRFQSLKYLRDVLNALDSLGVKIDQPIYGIKPGADTGNLVRFDLWLARRMKNKSKMREQHALALDYAQGRLFNVDGIVARRLPTNSDARAYVELYKEACGIYQSNAHTNRATVFAALGEVITATGVLRDLSEAFKAKYPMLRIVQSYNMDEQEVLDYIALVDKCNDKRK